MYAHYDDICHGVLDIFSVRTAAGLANNPLSYITKICHIINPNAYPLIWDSRVRKNMGIYYRRGTGAWEEKFNRAREIVKAENIDEEEAYTRESKLWAGETTE